MANVIPDSSIRSWLRSSEIIGAFLKELRPDLSKDQVEHNAAAIIARLARNEPPLLIGWENEFKE